MKIIPVIDVLNGLVVRGIAGRREEYRPLISCLTSKFDVVSVARAFRDQFGLTRLYLADLDAIVHERPHFDLYRQLVDEGFELMVDAGLRDFGAAHLVLQTGVAQVIVGLETWPGPEELKLLCDQLGRDQIVFSLDLKGGHPLGRLDQWNSDLPLEIGSTAYGLGVHKMIVLDVAQVGVGQGVTTIPLCQELARKCDRLKIITGGGIRTSADLELIDHAKIDGVLVASAIHDGRLNPGDLARWRNE